MGILTLLLCASGLGLPMLMDPARCSIYYVYLLILTLTVLMDGILYLIFMHRLFTIPRNVLSFILTVFIVGSMLHQGMIKMPGFGSDYVSNGALTCLSNIIKENKDKTWTIVSANDETQMGLDHGWHYETITFLRNMEYMNKDAPIARRDIKKQQILMRMFRNFYRITAGFVLLAGLCLIPFLDILMKDRPDVNHLIIIYLLYLLNSVVSYLLIYKKTLVDGLDVGFAYDGDADRCLCVDEKGNVVDGDAILYIYGRYMKERGKLLTNTVVTTVMSNFGLYKAFDELGIGYAKTAVGDKYVYEYMTKNGCRIGGEQSGHIIFSKYASTGDGILTSLKMMEVMMAKKKKLSQLTEDLHIYPQVLVNVMVKDKAVAQADADVQAAISKVAERLGDTGRILVRESGTEPLIRVMIEAETKEICHTYVDEVVSIINKKEARQMKLGI